MNKHKELHEITREDFDHVEQFGRTWNLNIPSQRLEFAAQAIEAFDKRPDGKINMSVWFGYEGYEDVDGTTCYACAGGSAAFYAVNGQESAKEWNNRRDASMLVYYGNGNWFQSPIGTFENSLDLARGRQWWDFLSCFNMHREDLANAPLPDVDYLYPYRGTKKEDVVKSFREAADFFRGHGL